MSGENDSRGEHFLECSCISRRLTVRDIEILFERSKLEKDSKAQIAVLDVLINVLIDYRHKLIFPE